MKVPKMYKSSDRYNAGTDVIYDDDSKLQYAPFIYAGVTAKDNGDDDSGDEEGEDTMMAIYDAETDTINKSFKELKDAVNAGKIVELKIVTLDDKTGSATQIAYLTYLDNQLGSYNAYFSTIVQSNDTNELFVLHLEATNETDNMRRVSPNE